MRSWRSLSGLTGLAIVGSLLGIQSSAGAAQDDSPSYYRDVWPVIQQRCQGCHQPAQLGGELNLTSFEGLVTGGMNGPALVAGKPKQSRMLKMLRGEIEPAMPMRGEPLAEAAIAAISDWIAAGAADDTPDEVRLDPYRLYQDPNQPIQLSDLELRKETSPERLAGRFELRKGLNASMPDLEKAVANSALDEYYEKAYDLVLSGKARQAFDLSNESDDMRERYGRNTFGQGALMARRLIEAGTRFVQLNWPAVANGNPEIDSWDTHAANFGPLRNLHCPVFDRALSALLSDMDDRGLLDETLVVAVGEFGRSPRLGVSTSGNSNSPDGRDHWPYCYTALVAGAGVSRGQLYGESDETGSSPREKPVHPNDLLATVYHTLGIDPAMEILNHLDQPRELVKGEVIHGLWA